MNAKQKPAYISKRVTRKENERPRFAGASAYCLGHAVHDEFMRFSS